VARRGLLSVRRLSTAADWVLGDGRFSPRSSLPFVKVERKTRKERPDRNTRADRDRSAIDHRRWRSTCDIGTFERVSIRCRRQCVTSVTYLRLYFARREDHVALADRDVFRDCARERARSSSTIDAGRFVDRDGGWVSPGLHRRNGTIRLRSDQFGPAADNQPLCRRRRLSMPTWTPVASTNSRGKHSQMRQR